MAVPNASEVTLDASDVEEGVDVVQSRPRLRLLVSNRVGHAVLLPA